MKIPKWASLMMVLMFAASLLAAPVSAAQAASPVPKLEGWGATLNISFPDEKTVKISSPVPAPESTGVYLQVATFDVADGKIGGGYQPYQATKGQLFSEEFKIDWQITCPSWTRAYAILPGSLYRPWALNENKCPPPPPPTEYKFVIGEGEKTCEGYSAVVVELEPADARIVWNPNQAGLWGELTSVVIGATAYYGDGSKLDARPIQIDKPTNCEVLPPPPTPKSDAKVCNLHWIEGPDGKVTRQIGLGQIMVGVVTATDQKIHCTSIVAQQKEGSQKWIQFFTVRIGNGWRKINDQWSYVTLIYFINAQGGAGRQIVQPGPEGARYSLAAQGGMNYGKYIPACTIQAAWR